MAYPELVTAGDEDIYAQRLDANGLPMWELGSHAVCQAVGHQYAPKMVSDNRSGFTNTPGAIIVWTDERALSSSYKDIYAQAIDANGNDRFAPDGVPICTAPWSLQATALVTDGVAFTIHSPRGAIIVWDDQRVQGGEDIYAQRLDAAGLVRWGADGLPVCALPASQNNPQLAFAGPGAAIFGWQDSRNGNRDLYAQRVDFGDSWFPGGLPVCREPGIQTQLAMISDGLGGAILGWADARAGFYNIYADRLDGNGTSLWETDGAPVCVAAGDQSSLTVANTGDQGAYFAWTDQRLSGGFDIYAQRLDDAGAPVWAVDGIPVCTAAGFQVRPIAAPDGADGVYVVWQDGRNDSTDLYAMRMLPNAGATGVAEEDIDVQLVTASPNPFSGETTVRLVLPAAGRVNARIIGLDGRVVRTLAQDVMLPGGATTLRWNGGDDRGRPVPSGVYFVRIDGERGASTRRLVRTR